MAVIGGGFLAWNTVGDLFGQSAPADDFLSMMRKQLGAVPAVLTKLTDQVSMISGPGGNIAVYTWAEGKLAVDSGVVSANEAIQKQMDTLGAQPLRIVVNTHWHFDHTDGNEAFHKKGALIVGHENVRKRMGAPQFIDFMQAHVPACPAAALPETTFSSGMNFDLGDEAIRVTHVDPAHTDSDSVVQFTKANIVHAGDLLFSASYPFIDYSTGGNIGGMIAAADRTLALTDTSTRVIAGHGPVVNREELRGYRDMMAEIRDTVKKLKQQGKTQAEVIAAKPTQKFDEKWAKGMINPDGFTTLVYKTV